MQKLIEASLKSRRTVLLIFGFFIVAGLSTYMSIPKESSPDVKIPFISTKVDHRGISPADAEQLIVKPLEEELRNIEGVKEMIGQAYEGGARVVLEFHAGYDLDKALGDVRQKVSTAKANLPDDSKEPEIKEMNVSLFPVLVIHLSGQVPERSLFKISKGLQDRVETYKSVLSAPIVGDREEVVEAQIDPVQLESYGLSFDEVMGAFRKNHLIVGAGPLKTSSGSLQLKAPGLITGVQDIEDMPIKVHPIKDIVVRFKDVARVRRTYKDRQSYARDRGVPSVSLEVSKRTGENIIETITAVRNITEKFLGKVSDSVTVSFAQDDSTRIHNMLKDLQNNIILAVLLVMLVVIKSLGWRSSLLVGAAIPSSFLAGIFIMGLLGYTLNMVVLFSLILSVGMLVDGAIIVVEYADREMMEGASPFEAYKSAAVRMLWPVFTSTLTVLLVFLPLLFWPGVVGQFMKYLPLTLLATLTASLFVALIFVPTLGGIFGRVNTRGDQAKILAAEEGSLSTIKGGTGFYIRTLERLLRTPRTIIVFVTLLLFGVIFIYGKFGKGVEFFPDIEPDSASFLVRGRGNLSLEEQDRLVRQVEEGVIGSPYFKSVSTEVKPKYGTDVMGKITVELVDWQERPGAQEVFKDIMRDLRKIPGIVVELSKKKKGPSKGKDVQIEINGESYDLLAPEINRIRQYLETVEGLEDIDDSRPIPGLFEWELVIDRAAAAKFGLSVKDVGKAVEVLTSGIVLGSYRPDDSRDEVDVVFRFGQKHRSLDQLDQMRIKSPRGLIPLSLLAQWHSKSRVDVINRVNGKPSMELEANVNKKYLADDKVKEIQAWLETHPPQSDVTITFKGEEEDKKETGGFLVKAFLVALFLIVIVLVTQFNSFFSTLLVISAIVLSSIGVLIGLLVMNQAFSIVMSGIGVIALAGIIVSNNIIFIDTFDDLRTKFSSRVEAILRTGAQRLRPIVLTQLTTILGLFPILFQLNIDFLGAEITVGAPSSAWWVQLANAIVFGVFFASILTLVVTPCALMARENHRARKKKI